MLPGKRILLIVGGGIAAYKALELVRRLRERGAAVRVVLTRGGAEFVTPLSFSTLSGDKTFTDLFDLKDEAEIGHIQLSREADLVVVRPRRRTCSPRWRTALRNDLASTVLMATDKTVLVAPAMNVRMWEHPATMRNVATLRADGVRFVGPDEGDMACGEFGPGRMAEPEAIADAIERILPGLHGASLAGRHVLITAGPTYEPIDPVRYIANRSSGKQGHALARVAKDMGAKVTLVSGPTNLPDMPGVTTIKVETATDMLDAALAALPVDVAICAAAVADWRAAHQAAQKLKKEDGQTGLNLALARNPDILATLAAPGARRPTLVIGFAAETETIITHAQAKLSRKGADWIVANDVSPDTGIMGGDHTEVHLVSATGVEDWPAMGKDEMAAKLLARAAEALHAMQLAAE
ncbi:bifunctional phosphopantothenoylcysteine decarboxylase/phosphopantothenate synthase [Methyloceanibacter methanicus]|uniref:Coenzyme A biosynthesis bifunctional protein CoaBC n=1 Tax=Methyloceanibacter methanicus TaxID=1774968 RepID=A0A1E3W267_9HYPH|nr:bifunctional phosphopantothenoylcysteine decarboxylase/phosphopantothenate--cysteine ligase CoaBC [Methyloceanibacter methanicus]ODR99885.1 bifunctional phosphopantothenoylcysteine decarboxylase/phosphopantothenate synthase [Methyloceanibacter methanicus]